MSFPLNPTNGQQVIVNGIKYEYYSTTRSWRRDFNNALDRFFLVGNNQAINTMTGDLVVSGGAGFGKDVWVGGRLFATGGANFLGTLTGVISTASTAVSLSGGLRGDLVYQSSTGTTSFINISPVGSILLSNGTIPIWTTTAAISVASAVTATNLAGGVAGAIAFQSAVDATTFNANLTYNNQSLIIANTTTSTGTTSGALIINGGVGIAGNVFIGGSLQINGTTTAIQATNLEVSDKNIIIAKGAINGTAADGAGITVEGPTTQPTLLYANTTDSWNFNKLVRLPNLEVTSGVASSSTSTGAVKITGGLGVTGAIFAASINGSFTGTVGAGTKNTGAFTTVDVTAVTSSTSVSTGAITVAGGVGVAGNITADTIRIASVANSVSSSTGALVVAGGVGIAGNLSVGGTIAGTINNAVSANSATTALLATRATNIAGGLANRIPYQSAVDTTVYSANLTFNGTTLSSSRMEVALSTSQVLPNADSGLNLLNAGINQSPYIRLAGNSSGVILLSSFGSLRVLQDSTTTFSSSLLVVGPTGVNIPVVTNSVSTLTGSLTVAGGVGIGGDLNTTNANVLGNLITNKVISQIVSLTTASGVVIHDTNLAAKFFHTGMTANFTANFTNVPTTNNRELTLEIILQQGSTSGYYANIVQVNGSPVTVRYNVAPVPTANRIEVQTLKLIRVNSTWIVLGQLDEYV